MEQSADRIARNLARDRGVLLRIRTVVARHATARLLILSQVVLSLQLSFAVFPLVKFTSDKMLMGVFVNPRWLKALSWTVAWLIAGLNAYLLILIFRGAA